MIYDYDASSRLLQPSIFVTDILQQKSENLLVQL
jgi:hypothetical protein